jgi:hypothetical protein
LEVAPRFSCETGRESSELWHQSGQAAYRLSDPDLGPQMEFKTNPPLPFITSVQTVGSRNDDVDLYFSLAYCSFVETLVWSVVIPVFHGKIACYRS